MIENIKTWIRANFFTKKEITIQLTDKLDVPTYTVGSATPDGYLTIVINGATYRIPVELV
jgi:hypothetical protein